MGYSTDPLIHSSSPPSPQQAALTFFGHFFLRIRSRFQTTASDDTGVSQPLEQGDSGRFVQRKDLGSFSEVIP